MTNIAKCLKCGEIKNIKSKKSGLCGKCWDNNNMKLCPKCQKMKPRVTNHYGELSCDNCNKRVCDQCGKVNYIKRNNNGKLICRSCVSEILKRECCVCGEIKIIYSHKGGRDLCANCLQKENREICSVCEKLSPPNKRDENGKPICQECARRRGTCSLCGGQDKILKTKDNLCGSCRYKMKKEKCSVCGKEKSVAQRQDENPVCPECYERHRKKTDINYRVRKDVRRRITLAVIDKVYFYKYDVDYDGIAKYLGDIPDGEYHIDHIFPLSAFDLTDIIEFKIATCPENHQWLTKKENMCKNAKYNKKELEVFKEHIIQKYGLPTKTTNIHE